MKIPFATSSSLCRPELTGAFSKQFIIFLNIKSRYPPKLYILIILYSRALQKCYKLLFKKKKALPKKGFWG
jgi:hypothetical protein